MGRQHLTIPMPAGSQRSDFIQSGGQRPIMSPRLSKRKTRHSSPLHQPSQDRHPCQPVRQALVNCCLFTVVMQGPLLTRAISQELKMPEGVSQIPPGSILTPHPKEFERLFGKTKDSFEENELHREQAHKLGVYIVLKRAHTVIACPDGTCYFNATGNPGMATGGSGDVLTGIITGLLTQGYKAKEAAIVGVYIHGLAGDLAAKDLEHESLIAGDLINYLGKAFKKIKGKQH